jgi:hypothetical protein
MLKWLLVRLPIHKWVVVDTLNAVHGGAGNCQSVSGYIKRPGTVKNLATVALDAKLAAADASRVSDAQLATALRARDAEHTEFWRARDAEIAAEFA